MAKNDLDAGSSVHPMVAGTLIMVGAHSLQGATWTVKLFIWFVYDWLCMCCTFHTDRLLMQRLLTASNAVYQYLVSDHSISHYMRSC